MDFTRRGLVPPSAVGLKDTGVSGTEPVPGSVTLGVMVKPVDRLTWGSTPSGPSGAPTRPWSIEYDDPLFGSGRGPGHQELEQHLAFRFGAEYALTDDLDLRAGYVYDQSPVNGDYEDTPCPAPRTARL